MGPVSMRSKQCGQRQEEGRKRKSACREGTEGKKNGNEMYDETLPDHETLKGSQINDLGGNFVFTDQIS